jgi:hypothetical protein
MLIVYGIIFLKQRKTAPNILWHLQELSAIGDVLRFFRIGD